MNSLKVATLLLFACLTGNRLNAQLFSPVGLPGKVICYDATDDTLSVLTEGTFYLDTLTVDSSGIHADSVARVTAYTIYRKNGNQWDSVSTFHLYKKQKWGTSYVHFYYGLKRFKGDYYIDGCFDSIAEIPGKFYRTIRYKNHTWEDFFPYHFFPPGISGFRGTVFLEQPLFAQVDDSLYFYANATWRNTSYPYIFFKYYNNIWDTLVIPPGADPALGFLAGDHALFLCEKYSDGTFYQASGNKLVKRFIPGLVITKPGSSTKDFYYFHRADIIDGLLYAASDEYYKPSVWDGHKWNKMKGDSSIPRGFCMDVNGQLFSVNVAFNSSICYLQIYENNRWKVFAYINNAIYKPFNYKGDLHIFAADTNGILQLYRLKDYARIAGTVYHDANNNCVKDNGEKLYTNALIRFQPGNYIVNTDAEGHYVAFLDSGDYTPLLVSKKHHEAQCLAGPVSVKNGDRIRDVNLAQRPVPGNRDLSVSLSSLTGDRARRGTTIHYQLDIKNLGTEKAGGNLILGYDKRSSGFNTANAYTRLDSSAINFPLDSLPADSSKRINFTLYASEWNYVMGDKYKLSAWIINSYNDEDTLDNHDTLPQRIVAAYDPNEKQCYPGGIVTQPIKEVKYHICFQNLGNDSAVKIRIEDTLDMRLPVEEITVNSASHPYKFRIKNNVITWHFENIMLPPASVNYDKSQGYVSFTAKISGTMNLGDSIRNKAYIYFDYEEAVITNTAQVAYKEFDPTSVPKPGKTQHLGSLLVYPNPADDRLNITVKGAGSHNLSLYDMQGRLVSTYHLEGMGEHIINTGSLPAGVYTLKNNQGYFARVVIQR